MTTETWTRTADQLPPEGVEVETMDSEGDVQTLVLSSGLWFFPDRSMYVYYVPQAWRPVVPDPEVLMADAIEAGVLDDAL